MKESHKKTKMLQQQKLIKLLTTERNYSNVKKKEHEYSLFPNTVTPLFFKVAGPTYS